MTFRQIDAFRAVMLTGTVTNAATMLGVSQPAVSRLIADLEAEFDLKLFRRNGRRLAPTNEAHALYDEVQRSFSGLDRIREAAESIRDFKHQRLRFVAIPSIGSTIAIDLVKRFGEQHPTASIALEIQPTNSAVEWILSRQADLALAHPYVDNPAIESRVLHAGASVCLLPKGHPAADLKTVKPEHLAGESYVSFRPDSVYRHRIDSTFRDAGVRREMRFECRTTEAVCDMVAAGLGVAIVGPYLPRLKPGTLVVRPFKPSVKVELAAIWYAGQPLSSVTERFLALTETYLGSEVGTLVQADQ